MNKVCQSILELHRHFKLAPINFLDIGARWGIQRPWDQYPPKYINHFGFDADEKECNRLNKINKNKNCKFIPAALSNGNRKETLYITREPGRSSIYKPNSVCVGRFHDREGFEVVQEESIETTTLNRVMEEHSLDADFLKLDTQGAELKIIKGATDYYDRILGFEIEVEFLEIYENQPLFHEIDQYMRDIGFELFDLNRYWAKRVAMDLNYSNRGQVVFADAIYLRTPDAFFSGDHESDEDLKTKLVKMLCISILYGHHDAAIEMLFHRESPLSINEKMIQRLIHQSSIYPDWQRILFNNRTAQRIGILFHCLGNLFSYRSKTSGWGTDYETVDGRYAYHAPQSIVRLFGRK